MAPTPSEFSNENGLQIDIDDYLKWRAENSHIGVQYVNPYPQIFVPGCVFVGDDEASQKVCIGTEPSTDLSYIE